jgi:hypothetical protein
MGIHSLPARRWGQIGLVALLGLTLALVTVSAGHAKAGHAVEAKKKCKKKHKSAAAAKKKKCKKKRAVTPPVTPTTPTTPSGPTTRASVTWDTTDEVDMHVYDALGNHDFYKQDQSTIPDAEDNDQDVDGGPETFIDFQSPSTRTFTIYVCLYGYDADDPNGDGEGDVNVTVDITDPGGGHRSIPTTLNGVNDEQLVTVSPSSGTAFEATGFCGAPV